MLRYTMVSSRVPLFQARQRTVRWRSPAVVRREAAPMPEESCPYCGEVFVVLDRDDRYETTRQDDDGSVWRVIISRNWLAHRCEITDTSG
jgi:hypothetical protein